MTDKTAINLNAIWAEISARAARSTRRTSYLFDPDFYKAAYPNLYGGEKVLRRHFKEIGRSKGRYPNRYRQARAKHPDLDVRLAALITEPQLAQAFRDEVPGTGELAFELMQLGEGVDTQISDFSRDYYLHRHADITRAKIDPLLHYLYKGIDEGRASLISLRQNHHKGRRTFDPTRSTCLIITHDMSKTGAPIVALDLVREASETWNVVVLALRDGVLLERFRDHACEVVVTLKPRRDFDFFHGEAFGAISLAILNSMASFPAVELLVRKELPFVAYVHEYSQYCLPFHTYLIIPLYADLVVYSSEQVRETWLPLLADIDFDVARDSLVVPQRPVRIEPVSAEQLTVARARLSALIGRDCTNLKVVCGAGHVQIRKGTDIFVMAAQIMRRQDPDTIFVWIGDGLNREDLHFGVYLNTHLDLIDVGDPQGNLFFLPAGDYYPDVLAASDVMFLSSRLDPLPNVVFDALEVDCRVVFFKGGSGFSDPVYRQTNHVTPVEYANPAAAAEAIRAAPRKTPGDVRLQAFPPPLFSRIMNPLEARLRDQRYFVIGESPLDAKFLFSAHEADRLLRRRLREKIFRTRRRLFWRDAADAEEALADSGNWVHKACRIEPYANLETDAVPSFAIHIHAHYTDQLAEDIRRHAVLRLARRIVVTTDSLRKKALIQGIFEAEGLSPEIVVGPNCGRDILPFLNLFEPGGPAGDDTIWCHIHQKKSIETAGSGGGGGDRWRRFLMAILWGQDDGISVAARLIGEKGTGLVTAFDLAFCGWNGARALLPKIAGSFPGPLPSNPLLFPIGNMFWVRRDVVLAMKAVFGPDYPWPNEPIANDGTEFHLIERLWPAVAASLGLNSIFLNDPSLTRG